MTANICFARMLAEGVLYTRVDTLNRGVLAADETLGHEAVDVWNENTDVYNIACINCGSVFVVETE